MKENNVRETDSRIIRSKRDIQESWTFIVAGIIYLSLTFLPNVSNILLGISFLLLAGTITFTSFKVGERLKKGGRNYVSSAVIVYGAGGLSVLWITEGINLLF